MEPVRLSPAIEADVASLLASAAGAGHGHYSDALLDSIAQRVCTEAHALGIASEQVVVALRAVYSSALREVYSSVSHGHGDVTGMRNAYDRLLSHCLKAYFDTAPPLRLG
jgi:hypothetical protein